MDALLFINARYGDGESGLAPIWPENYAFYVP
jgi:hypothetical protein